MLENVLQIVCNGVQCARGTGLGALHTENAALFARPNDGGTIGGGTGQELDAVVPADLGALIASNAPIEEFRFGYGARGSQPVESFGRVKKRASGIPMAQSKGRGDCSPGQHLYSFTSGPHDPAAPAEDLHKAAGAKRKRNRQVRVASRPGRLATGDNRLADDYSRTIRAASFLKSTCPETGSYARWLVAFTIHLFLAGSAESATERFQGLNT